MRVNGPEGYKLARKKSPTVSVACKAIYRPAPGFKGRTLKLCVLTRWDFNFCVRSSPPRNLRRVSLDRVALHITIKELRSEPL